MFKIGRALFLIGGVLLLFVFLFDAFIYQSFESVTTKILAVIATTLLVWFADAGQSDIEI
jgi:hypothetical protein